MNVFEAVAEPNRRALLDLLVEGERPAGDLVASLPSLTQSAVSRHLRVLREARLVDVRPQGQQRISPPRGAGSAGVDDWLDRHRRYWHGHLDALERHLADRHGRPTGTTGTTGTTDETDETDESGDAGGE